MHGNGRFESGERQYQLEQSCASEFIQWSLCLRVYCLQWWTPTHLGGLSCDTPWVSEDWEGPGFILLPARGNPAFTSLDVWRNFKKKIFQEIFLYILGHQITCSQPAMGVCRLRWQKSEVYPPETEQLCDHLIYVSACFLPALHWPSSPSTAGRIWVNQLAITFCWKIFKRNNVK
jgi:hypothetical protein